jgi:hypothetical protein
LPEPAQTADGRKAMSLPNGIDLQSGKYFIPEVQKTADLKRHEKI